MNCARCHAGPGGAPAAPIEVPTGDFPHDVHRDAGLQCSTCHAAPAMSAKDLNCGTCHDLHHQAEATCLSCHREGVQAKHDRSFAHTVACTQCHGAKIEGVTRWSRQVCTVCHTDRVEHHAPTDCVQCHRISPMHTGGVDSTSRLEHASETWEGEEAPWLQSAVEAPP